MLVWRNWGLACKHYLDTVASNCCCCFWERVSLSSFISRFSDLERNVNCFAVWMDVIFLSLDPQIVKKTWFLFTSYFIYFFDSNYILAVEKGNSNRGRTRSSSTWHSTGLEETGHCIRIETKSIKGNRGLYTPWCVWARLCCTSKVEEEDGPKGDLP